MDNVTKAYKVCERLELSRTALIQAHQLFYAYVLFYKAEISLSKISVCLFLLRIFRTTSFRYVTYAMIGINAAIAISWIFADAFRCDPIHLAWTKWEDPNGGKCVNFVKSTIANAFVNLFVDLAMILMPIYEVLKLNLSARKKLGVALMFATGLVYVPSGETFHRIRADSIAG